jgi:hypothetical protein
MSQKSVMKQVSQKVPKISGATVKNIIATASWCPKFVHPWCTVYRDTFLEILISHKEKQTGMDRRNNQTQEQMKSEGNKEVKGEASKWK